MEWAVVVQSSRAVVMTAIRWTQLRQGVVVFVPRALDFYYAKWKMSMLSNDADKNIENGREGMVIYGSSFATDHADFLGVSIMETYCTELRPLFESRRELVRTQEQFPLMERYHWQLHHGTLQRIESELRHITGKREIDFPLLVSWRNRRHDSRIKKKGLTAEGYAEYRALIHERRRAKNLSRHSKSEEKRAYLTRLYETVDMKIQILLGKKLG
eukprot:scaffold7940_cov167-Amphora_coffeaeformis.AAC.7